MSSRLSTHSAAMAVLNRLGGAAGDRTVAAMCNYRRGDWTTEAIEERRWLRSLVHAFAKKGSGR
jgi:hypothetical protein